MTRLLQGVIVILLALLPARASAQAEAPGLRPHRVILSAAIHWTGDYDVGESTAQLRGNGTGTTPPPFTFFVSHSRVTGAITPEFRVGVALARTLSVDGGIVVSHPHVAFGISGDAEAPSQALVGEQLQQYVIDGAVTWQLPWHSGRLAPFVVGGAGYLRQLHQDRMLGETGQLYYGGGGARYWLKGSRTSHAVGIRGDVRFNIRRNGIDFDNATRTYPSFTLGMFLGL